MPETDAKYKPRPVIGVSHDDDWQGVSWEKALAKREKRNPTIATTTEAKNRERYLVMNDFIGRYLTRDELRAIEMDATLKTNEQRRAAVKLKLAEQNQRWLDKGRASFCQEFKIRVPQKPPVAVVASTGSRCFVDDDDEYTSDSDSDCVSDNHSASDDDEEVPCSRCYKSGEECDGLKPCAHCVSTGNSSQCREESTRSQFGFRYSLKLMSESDNREKREQERRQEAARQKSRKREAAEKKRDRRVREREVLKQHGILIGGIDPGAPAHCLPQSVLYRNLMQSKHTQAVKSKNLGPKSQRMAK